MFYTPCQYRGNSTAGYTSDGAGKGRLGNWRWCPSFHHTLLAYKAFIPFTSLCSASALTANHISSKCSLFSSPWRLRVTVPLAAPQASSFRNSVKRCAPKTVCAHWPSVYQAAEELLNLLPYYQSNRTPIKVFFCSKKCQPCSWQHSQAASWCFWFCLLSDISGILFQGIKPTILRMLFNELPLVFGFTFDNFDRKQQHGWDPEGDRILYCARLALRI